MSHNDNRGPRRNYNGNRGERNHDRPNRPKMEEDILGTRVVEGERKTLTLTHRRNANGEFLRIDELRTGQERPNTVIVPADMVDLFLAAGDELFPEAETAGATPDAVPA